MKITIQMYALLKDHFGDSVQLDLPERSTIGDVKNRLVRQNSESESLLDRCRFAINQEMVALDKFATQIVNGADSVDVLPPSSGG